MKERRLGVRGRQGTFHVSTHFGEHPLASFGYQKYRHCSELQRDQSALSAGPFRKIPKRPCRCWSSRVPHRSKVPPGLVQMTRPQNTYWYQNRAATSNSSQYQQSCAFRLLRQCLGSSGKTQYSRGYPGTYLPNDKPRRPFVSKHHDQLILSGLWPLRCEQRRYDRFPHRQSVSIARAATSVSGTCSSKKKNKRPSDDSVLKAKDGSHNFD